MQIGLKGKTTDVARMIGSYEGDKGGKQVLIIAGVHGNEQSGVRALQTVLAQLEKIAPPFVGSIVGLAGNCAAIKEGDRYIDKDLNRNWTPEIVEKLRNTPLEELESSEDCESKELLSALDFYLSGERAKKTVFMDLHGTSAGGGGFSIINDTPQNQALAELLQLPVIYGLEAKLWATLQNHLYRQGVPGILFEGGQIGTRECEEIHVAGLWVLLAGTGCVKPADIPNFEQYEEKLANAAKDLPTSVKISYRHAISSEESFKFLAGFRNFQPVWEGMHLAINSSGAVYSPREGLLLMPLYQAQGQDGFFLVEEIDHA